MLHFLIDLSKETTCRNEARALHFRVLHRGVSCFVVFCRGLVEVLCAAGDVIIVERTERTQPGEALEAVGN